MDANRATWNRRTNMVQTVLYSSMQRVHGHNTVQVASEAPKLLYHAACTGVVHAYDDAVVTHQRW